MCVALGPICSTTQNKKTLVRGASRQHATEIRVRLCLLLFVPLQSRHGSGLDAQCRWKNKGNIVCVRVSNSSGCPQILYLVESGLELLVSLPSPLPALRKTGMGVHTCDSTLG